jgi:hypothetical protein
MLPGWLRSSRAVCCTTWVGAAKVRIKFWPSALTVGRRDGMPLAVRISSWYELPEPCRLTNCIPNSGIDNRWAPKRKAPG